MAGAMQPSPQEETGFRQRVPANAARQVNSGAWHGYRITLHHRRKWRMFEHLDQS